MWRSRKALVEWSKLIPKIYRLYVSAVKAFITTAMFIAFVFLAYRAGKDIFSEKIVIKPFNVPPALQDKGYTGDVILSRLMKKIQAIRRTVNSENNPAVEIAPPSQGPDIEIPGAGVSLNSVISYLRVFLGRPPLQVSGSVVLQEQAHLIIGIPGKK